MKRNLPPLLLACLLECTIDYCFDEKKVIVVETAEADSDVAGVVVVAVNIEHWEDWGTWGVGGVLVVDTYAVAFVAVVDTDKGVCIVVVVEGTSYTVVETVDDTVVVVEFGDVVAEKTVVDGIAEPSSSAVVGISVVDVIWLEIAALLGVVVGKEKVVDVVVDTVVAASCLVVEAEHRRVCKKETNYDYNCLLMGDLNSF